MITSSTPASTSLTFKSAATISSKSACSLSYITTIATTLTSSQLYIYNEAHEGFQQGLEIATTVAYKVQSQAYLGCKRCCAYL